jgi:hypothetical protein
MSFFNPLKKPNNPALPLPTPDYSRTYHDNHNNVLRLFFNQIQNVFDNLLSPNGGQFIDCPNGLFFNTQDQIPPVAPTAAAPVVYNQTYLSNGVFLKTGSTSRIEVGISGVYNFQYSGQLLSTNSSAKTIYLFIKRNGVAINYSTHAYTLSSNNEYLEVSWNFNIDLAAGEDIELEIVSTGADVELHADAPTAPHVGIPSSVMVVSFVAPMPDPRPALPP